MTTAAAIKNKEPINYADLIGIKASDRIELSKKIKIGFPYKSFISLTKFMNVSNQQLAELVQISDRTLVRRRKVGVLNSEESERLLRFARIFTLAIELFECDNSATQNWLSSTNRALGGETPLEASKTEEGSREVENLIARLEHGVFS